MDVKYLIDGDAVTVVGTSPHGHLVSKLYESHNEYGEVELGTPFIAQKIFDTAPTEIFEQKVKDLQDKIEEKEKFLRTLNADVASYKKQIKEYEHNKSKFPDLSCVLDIAMGNKMYIVYEDTLEIKLYPDETKNNHDDNKHEMRSVSWLSVYNEKVCGRRMQLYLGQYSDLSGGRYAIKAFKEKADAEQFLKQKIMEVFNTERVGTIPYCNAIRAANSIGYDACAVVDARAALKAYKDELKQNRIKQLEDELAKLTKENTL